MLGDAGVIQKARVPTGAEEQMADGMSFFRTDPQNEAQPIFDERIGLLSVLEILPCRKSITTR